MTDLDLIDLDSPTATHLRGALQRSAADVDLTPPGPDAVRRHAHRRARRHRQVMAGITAVALVGAGVGLGQVVAPEPGIELAPATQPDQPGATVDLTWSSAESLLAPEPRIAQDADGVLYALSTSPGVTWEDVEDGLVPQAIYRSADGADWELVADLDEDLRLSGLDVADGVLYGVTTAPGTDDTTTLQLATSIDGTSWAREDLPALTPAPQIAGDLILSGGAVFPELVRTVSGSVVVVERHWYLQTADQDDPDATRSTWVEATPEGAQVREVTLTEDGARPVGADPEAAPTEDRVVETIPWADLGLEGPQDLIRTEVFSQAADGSWQVAELPDGDVQGVVETDGGILALMTQPGDGAAAAVSVVRSADGATWTAEPTGLQLLDAWSLDRVGNTLVVAGVTDPQAQGLSISTSTDDGRTWTTTPLGSLLAVPEGAEVTSWPIVTGPLGVVAVISTVDQASGEPVAPAAILHSPDGTSWTSLSIEEMGVPDISWFRWAHVGDDQIILDARRDDGSALTLVGVPTR